MADKYRVSSTHPEDLADGRVLGAGEQITDLDASDPHNKRLIDDGRLVKIATAKKRSAKPTTNPQEASA